MSAKRDAAKQLGLALQVRYRTLLMASGEDEVAAAAVDLGTCFNDNIEFVINVLKDYGGMPVQFEKRRKAIGKIAYVR